MALADLHVHSMYSKHPAQWFLQRIGTQESYTEIEDVYRIAKERGMTYVTISDHNTIEGALKLVERYPDDTFVSVEATTYFPEDGCKIHILVYDLNEQQFQEVDRIRTNIYDLRDYMREQHLAHSVAHATYNINSRLQFETLEKLILLFDTFEEINGARNPKYNFTWGQALTHLTPEDIDRLYSKHHIEPFSDDPWNKGLTGGSDDHAGLFIGQTFTETECESREEFIHKLKTKNTSGGGKSSNFKSLAFAVYKIACDFSQNGNGKKPTGSLAFINSLLFENKKPGFRKRLAVKTMKTRHGDEKVRIFTKFLDDLMTDFRAHTTLSIDEKIDKLYEKIASMTDEFFSMIFESLERDFRHGDMSGPIKNVSAILPAIFLSAPFFSTLKHLSDDRELNTRIKKEFIDKYKRSEKHVLWFSDTFDDAHEITKTFKQAMHSAYHQKRSLRFVISNPAIGDGFSPNLINLPAIYSYTPDFYPSYTMYVASLLKSLEIIYQQNPDEIIISTPGPLGFLGIITAKLLGIPCTGIFQTDFAEQVKSIFPDDYFADPINGYLRWFGTYMDTMYVPNRKYLSILEEQGYDSAALKVLPKAVDTSFFRYNEDCAFLLEKTYNIPQGFTLLVTGPTLGEQNVSMLADTYKRIVKRSPETNLILADEGAALDDLHNLLQSYSRVVRVTTLELRDIPTFYSFADLLLCPECLEREETCVLQAQACGLPVLVAETNSAQTVIRNHETGAVLPPNDIHAWVEAMSEMIILKQDAPQSYTEMRQDIRSAMESHYSWEQALTLLIGPKAEPSTTAPSYRPAAEYLTNGSARNGEKVVGLPR